MKKNMLALFVITAAVLSSPVLSAPELTCHQAEICVDSPVSCECREALIVLDWSVTSTNSSMLYEVNHRLPGDTIGEVRVDNGYTSVLCDVTTPSNGPGKLTSKLNFTLTSNVHVKCADNVGNNMTSLQRASKITSSELLKFTTSSAHTYMHSVMLKKSCIAIIQHSEK